MNNYKYCPNCGIKLSRNASFCSNCGYSFKNNQSINPPLRVPNQYNHMQHHENHNYSWWIIGLCSIIAVIIGGVILINKPSSKSSSPSKQTTSRRVASNDSNNKPKNKSDNKHRIMSKNQYKEYDALSNVIDVASNCLLIDTSNENDIANSFVGGKHNPNAQSMIKWTKLNNRAVSNNKITYDAMNDDMIDSNPKYRPSGNKVSIKVYYTIEFNKHGNLSDKGNRYREKKVFLWHATFDKHTHLIKTLKCSSKPLSQSIHKVHPIEAKTS